MKFAFLSAAELRLIDLLLERGAFPDPPASVIRRDRVTTAPDGTKPRTFPYLRARMPEALATRRPVGDVMAHGSIAELLDLLTHPPGRASTRD